MVSLVRPCGLTSPLVVTADRKPDKLPTTVDGGPMAALPSGPLPTSEVRPGSDALEDGDGEADRSGGVAIVEGTEGMDVDEVR